MSTSTITAPVPVKPARTRRKALPGEVNITNDAGARALLTTVRERKVLEREGAAAARERKVAEGALREIMGDSGKVLVINGQPVAKVSSPRHTTKVDLAALALGWPEAYAAVVSEVPYTYLEV